ncbi:MAG: hypothetical protein M1517_07025 [Deltaproteobacteria bacterium]|nr:hypothetical protein [Deltaproteobacteria bacterium]
MISEAERSNITRWSGGPGHYEVYYIKFNHTGSATAYWIRYTLLAPLSGGAVAELWGVSFDSEDPSKNMAVKGTFPVSGTEIGKDRFSFKVGGATISQTGASGTIRGKEGTMRWDLRFGPVARVFRHFPYDFLYSAGFPKTKVVSPNFSIKVYGRVEVNGRTYECKGEPGQQTHLWGTKHAERWTWASCNSFKGDDTAVFEGLSAQVRTTGGPGPALTLLFVRCGGKDYPLNGIVQLLRNRSESAFPTWRLGAVHGGMRFTGEIGAPAEAFVGVEYTDPDGERLWCYNTEVANMELEVYDHGKKVEVLTSAQSCALEFGGRTMLPGIPIRI